MVGQHHDDAVTFLGDAFQRGPQRPARRTAVFGADQVAQRVQGMDADQGRGLAIELAHHHGQVNAPFDAVFVGQ